jgi:hypothetical protein
MKTLGFFRVNYEEENWNALISQLHNDCNEIHVLNRAQLIDDAFNLGKGNRMDYAMVLNLSEYLKNENDPIPWYSAQNGFAYLLDRMRRCPNGYKQLKVNNNYYYQVSVEGTLVRHDHNILLFYLFICFLCAIYRNCEVLYWVKQ